MARLFRECGSLPKHYTLAQIDQGLNYLCCNACSNYFHDILDTTVPRSMQEEVFVAARHLYSDLFAKHCTHFYCHLDRGPEQPTPLNGVCHMLWDIGGLNLAFHVGDVAETALGVFEHALRETNPACIESVLHGLGHYQDQYPRRVAELLDKLRERHPDLPRELRRYWRAASVGYVQ